MKILILGVSGMIGSAMFNILAIKSDWQVIGSVRAERFSEAMPGKVYTGIDLNNHDKLLGLFLNVKPDVVINCAGLTKHLLEGNDEIPALSMNALLPHRLAKFCALIEARLIHISSDCVFSGKKGKYLESDATDADDVYGKTKAFGEVTEGNVITLRTSTIGHENGTKLGLLEWFLQQTSCQGYTKAIFSGLPSVELARVVRDFVIPSSRMTGLYHVGASAIDKYSLLHLINEVYKKECRIERNDNFCIDRSLCSDKFTAATGYRAPAWRELIEIMFKQQNSKG